MFRKSSALKRFLWLIPVLFVATAVWGAPAEDELSNENCLACHDTIHAERFSASVHGGDRCTSCHSDIREIPHEETLKKVSCADCHELESQIYLASDHGKAGGRGDPAALCLDCHGDPHTVTVARDPSSPVNRANVMGTCGRCHGDAKKMAQYHLLESEPLKSYMDSVHGQARAKRSSTDAATCTDCHGSHDLHASSNPESHIFRANVPATCGKCHADIYSVYKASVHGMAVKDGKRDAPVCTDCHGEHNILSHLDPRSAVYSTALSEKTCGHCHGAEKLLVKNRLPMDRLATYRESYHGMAGKLGVRTVANCASCHGAHNILPSSDPRSSVNKNNLAQTCGKCHPNAGDQLSEGRVHVSKEAEDSGILLVVRVFYRSLIVLVIGGMILHNLLDFTRKFIEVYRRRRERPGSLHFTPNERLQHAVLFVSFTVLAYTGFALKYSDAWWTRPLAMPDLDYDLRGVIHRGAAIIFTALTFYHGWYMVFTVRGRRQLEAFRPGRQDFSEFFGMTRYYLGLSRLRPKKGHYGYVEKAEYWALVWGSGIMILTGALLSFENFALQHYPKWALDVADAVHFYEAVLATLAIVVWHFYFTIFDPEHYPMNLSMITGKNPSSSPDAGKKGRRES